MLEYFVNKQVPRRGGVKILFKTLKKQAAGMWVTKQSAGNPDLGREILRDYT